MARRRSTFNVYSPARGPLVVVICDLTGQPVHRTGPIPADRSRAALEAEVARWVADGWVVEGGFQYGHAFMHKDGRRLGIGLQSIAPAPHHGTPATAT